MKPNELVLKVVVRYTDEVASDREALAELVNDALVKAAENRELTIDPEVRIRDIDIDFKQPIKLTNAFGDDGI